MDIQNAYNRWARTYDSAENKTRDLEALALRTVLVEQSFNTILEAGCGTGKNTGFLKAICNKLICADFSQEMMDIAKSRYPVNVTFIHFDLNQKWQFDKADLIVCSLVLEHISDIEHIFSEAYSSLEDKGTFYICELHPYRQMAGSKARFEEDNVITQVDSFTHHISEYITFAFNSGFNMLEIREWFDDDDRNKMPRLCSFLFEKR